MTAVANWLGLGNAWPWPWPGLGRVWPWPWAVLKVLGLEFSGLGPMTCGLINITAVRTRGEDIAV